MVLVLVNDLHPQGLFSFLSFTKHELFSWWLHPPKQVGGTRCMKLSWLANHLTESSRQGYVTHMYYEKGPFRLRLMQWAHIMDKDMRHFGTLEGAHFS
jgi:hypothetical protein